MLNGIAHTFDKFDKYNPKTVKYFEQHKNQNGKNPRQNPLDRVEGHFNPGLINPKLQPQTFQPQTF